MSMVVLLIVVVPFAMTLASIVLPRRTALAATVGVGILTFVLALTLIPEVARHGPITVGDYLRVDAVSLVFMLATAFLYAVTAVYSVGYFAHNARQASAAGMPSRTRFSRYMRLFTVGFNAFAWSMLCAPLVDGLALLWVAIEITTVVSALLVALDRTADSTEAAWKYVLIASSGLGIALFATILMYYAGAQVLGDSYDLSFSTLIGHAGTLPATPVRLAFVLAVVGFGTKVGLFPVHTWLPDAHAEAPTPVSILLSGALLATSFYAIVRYFQITAATLGPAFPRAVMLVFGILSLAFAALYLIGQRNIKRMLAYSSIEHMGVLAIALGFGAPIALAGLLLHVLAHASAKSTAFMGAGVLVHAYGTKELSRMRGAVGALRYTAPLFLLAVFTLSALPPFAIFRSEFQIIAGGLSGGGTMSVAAAVLVILVTVAFLGLVTSSTRVLFAPSDREWQAVRSEPSAVMVIAMAAALLGALILGVHPPADLVSLLHQGALELAGGV